MCGIAGIHVLHPTAAADMDIGKLAAALLRAIDHRGGDATGAGSFGPEGMSIQKASCRAHGFLSEWSGVPAGTRTVLLHTRYATQGKAAFPENNHPVEYGPIHVVHNGHISNDAEVFRTLGKDRRARVDSEAIPAAILAAGWDAAGAGLERLSGAFAIAAVNAKAPGELLLAKSGYSPLVWTSNRRILVWASEEAAIRQAWKEAYGGRAPRRMRWLVAGDIVRVRGAKVSEATFVARDQGYAGWSGSYSFAWTADDDLVAPVQRPSAPVGNVCPAPTIHPLDLTQAVETAAEQRPSDVRVWRNGAWSVWTPEQIAEQGKLDVGLASVRCAWCAHWCDPLVMDEAFGELVCEPCKLDIEQDIAYDKALR